MPNAAPATSAQTEPQATGPAEPSEAFKACVRDLPISSVRGGSSPRILIGATSYREGDVIHPQLGITFESYDDSTRLLLFKDRSGATVSRKY